MGLIWGYLVVVGVGRGVVTGIRRAMINGGAIVWGSGGGELFDLT